MGKKTATLFKTSCQFKRFHNWAKLLDYILKAHFIPTEIPFESDQKCSVLTWLQKGEILLWKSQKQINKNETID